LRNYAPGGKQLDLAVRISGDAKTAFPAGAPKPGEKTEDKKTEGKKDGAAAASDAKPETTAEATKKADDAKPAVPAGPGPNHVATGNVNAIVVADTDFLADRFWVENRDMLGQQFVVPSASNGAFVVGALENLTGSDAMLALRGRGIKDRTFTLVENLRRDAERQYREKEEALTAKLKSAEAELQKHQTAAATNNVIGSEQETAVIEGFKAQVIETRRELRQVKLALGQSITSLDGWLKFANIALVPLLIAAGGIGWSVWRARRTGPKA
jgi:ABC-type uncharacterized transport system involved in gliding motility auxiliary subunit